MKKAKPIVSADVKARAKATRAKLVDRPGPDRLLTADERADGAPFYFALRTFIHGLKKRREKAGLTLADVAKKAGLAEETVCRLETGKATNPNWQSLGQYAAAVGVTDMKITIR